MLYSFGEFVESNRGSISRFLSAFFRIQSPNSNYLWQSIDHGQSQTKPLLPIIGPTLPTYNILNELQFKRFLNVIVEFMIRGISVECT